ncbi:TPA: ead/Ea22-like family protein [Klebsiella variicola subsp. variicola]
MTDITELAQSLKAAAEKATPGNWRAFQYHDGRCGVGGGNHDEIMVCEHISKKRPHDALFIALANPANVLALVEAVEKAQKTIAFQQGEIKALLSSMESRTVTVKLPDIMPPEAAPAHYWGPGESMAYADGYNKSAAELKTSFAQACSSVGVNVEFE